MDGTDTADGQAAEAEWDQSRARGPLTPGLYLVATPIGNLEDITLRALRVLREVDRIACEDTRQTLKLLNHYGIKTPMVSYHRHNEAGRALELVAELTGGAKIAVVSDAGTPGIADPGVEIVAEAIAAGVPVFPVPGANAAVAAVIASGLGTERVRFHGFLPSKAGERRTLLEGLPRGEGTEIFYETPHRIVEALADVESVFGPGEQVVVARELTKVHEEFCGGRWRRCERSLRGGRVCGGRWCCCFHLRLRDLRSCRRVSRVRCGRWWLPGWRRKRR